MKKILALVAFIVLAISQPAYGHSSNQHLGSGGIWQDNECSDGTPISYAVTIWQYHNYNGMGLEICNGVKNLANFSFGDTSGTWDNKGSSEYVNFRNLGYVCEIVFWQNASYGGRSLATTSDIPDFSAYTFDNLLSSIGKIPC